MKKVIVGLIVVIFFAGTIGFYVAQPNRLLMESKDNTYNEIMEQDLEYDYPETPTDVVKLYCKIEALLYSVKFDGKREGRLEELVRKQLELCDDELIEFNGGEDKIILTTRDDTEKFLDAGFKIMDVRYQTSTESALDENGDLLRFVNVIEYVSIGDNAYKKYALRRDENKRWKILTYANVEEFTIS